MASRQTGPTSIPRTSLPQRDSAIPSDRHRAMNPTTRPVQKCCCFTRGTAREAPAFLLWHILLWPCSVFSPFRITKQQSHIAQLTRNLSFPHRVVCRGENVYDVDPLRAPPLPGTCKKTLQVPFPALSSRSCLLSANNPGFIYLFIYLCI